MNETNIRVCLIVFHFHLFVVGLWWMQEANSFGFKKCIVERQCIFCMPILKHLARYLSLFLPLSYPFIHQRCSPSLAKAMLLAGNCTAFTRKSL